MVYVVLHPKSNLNPTGVLALLMGLMFLPINFCYPHGSQSQVPTLELDRYAGAVGIIKVTCSKSKTHNIEAQVGIKFTTLCWESETKTTTPSCTFNSP